MRFVLFCFAIFATATMANAAVVSTTTHADGTLAAPGPIVSGILSGDLLEEAGVVASESNAATGWHGAAPAEPERFVQVTDGVGPNTGTSGLLNDFAGAPVNVFTYALAGPRDISQIRIIGGNYGGDGRAFITALVEASTDGGGIYSGVGGAGGTGYYQSDPSGTINSPALENPFEETMISIFDDAGGKVVSGATHLRISMFSVDNTGGEMRDPYDGVNPYTGADDGLTAAFVSPLIWEIDVIPEPSTCALMVGLIGILAVRRRS